MGGELSTHQKLLKRLGGELPLGFLGLRGVWARGVNLVTFVYIGDRPCCQLFLASMLPAPPFSLLHSLLYGRWVAGLDPSWWFLGQISICGIFESVGRNWKKSSAPILLDKITNQKVKNGPPHHAKHRGVLVETDQPVLNRKISCHHSYLGQYFCSTKLARLNCFFFFTRAR